MILFAQSLRRNPTLGFCRQRGTYEAFLATVIYRCCQNGVRQFRRGQSLSPPGDHWHPVIDDQDEVDELLDLRQSMRKVSEPYRTALRLHCHGKSIEEIFISNAPQFANRLPVD